MTSVALTSRQITRKMTEIENAVKKRLTTFYNKEIKPFATITPAESLRRIHEDRVKSIIRKAIQDAYLSGTQIVGDKINEKVSFEMFISQTDIENISRLTTKLNNDFWRTADRLVQRETEYIMNKDQELEKKKSFDADAAIGGVSSDIAHESFNEAIVHKMVEAMHYFEAGHFILKRFVHHVLPSLRIPFPSATTPPPVPSEFATEFFFPEDEFPTQEFLLDMTQLGGKIMFLTREDEKVDPDLCEPLNRTEYEVDDPTMPLPPLHRYCRCRLVPVMQEEPLDVGVGIGEFTGVSGSPF